MKLRLLLILIAAIQTFSFQAQRDTVELSDTVTVDPLDGLRFINLMPESESGNSFLFQVDGDSSLEKVSYFGNNLAQYVCNVSSAKKKIDEYRNLRATQSGLLIGGLVLTAIGTSFTVKNGEFSPTILLGVGTAAFSWIPAYLTHNKIPEAVGSYNAVINQRNKISDSRNYR